MMMIDNNNQLLNDTFSIVTSNDRYRPLIGSKVVQLVRACVRARVGGCVGACVRVCVCVFQSFHKFSSREMINYLLNISN